jgi:hypothetical protein
MKEVLYNDRKFYTRLVVLRHGKNGLVKHQTITIIAPSGPNLPSFMDTPIILVGCGGDSRFRKDTIEFYKNGFVQYVEAMDRNIFTPYPQPYPWKNGGFHPHEKLEKISNKEIAESIQNGNAVIELIEVKKTPPKKI